MKIFVTIGTQRFQFDRLLKKIDELIEEKYLKSEDLLVQCVYSEYKPKHYETFYMKPQRDIEKIMKDSDLIITHSGTGSIITALSLSKKVIVVPRLKKYGEHVDDHQIELAEVFKEKANIIVVTDMDKLKDAIEESRNHAFGPWKSNNKRILACIDNDIASIEINNWR